MTGRIACFVLALCLLAPAARAEAPDLAEAYKKEFAFLEAQKTALAARLAALEQERADKIDAAKADLARSANDLLALRARGDAAERSLAAIEARVGKIDERRDALAETLARARASLAGLDAPLSGEFAAPEAMDDAARAQAFSVAFARGTQALREGGVVRREPGAFFLADGTRTEGTLVHLGRIASYGTAPNHAGALVPVGPGRLRLRPEVGPDAEAARALAAGEHPETLAMFLYESREKGIEERAEKTALETIDSGGVIAWVIVALGCVAALLIALRLVILSRAGTSTDRLVARLAPLLDAGRRDEALAACKHAGGAAGRVLLTTVRNLDREREHLEDLVAEAIMHETPHIERFAAAITVSAAVAPLLGLLGTVTGMIATFDVITEFGTGDPKMLSGGISEALVTTELGLLVAIPALLAGTLLSARGQGILDGMERAALRVMNHAHGGRGPTGGEAGA